MSLIQDKPLDLKLLSLNIHKGFNWKNDSLILENLRNVIRTENADLVFLQEVVGENRLHLRNESKWPKEPQFEFLAHQIWDHYSYGQNAVYPEGHHGNAILSKFPITFWKNINLSTNKLEQRGLLHCIIEIPPQNFKIHLLCTHLNLIFGRSKQINMISEYLKTTLNSNEPIILAGDFNDWDKKAAKHFTTDLKFLDLLEPSIKTFPALHPILRLDGIYTHQFQKIHSKIHHSQPWDSWSDHSALIAQVRLL